MSLYPKTISPNVPFSHLYAERILILANQLNMGGLNYIVADQEVTEDQLMNAMFEFTVKREKLILSYSNIDDFKPVEPNFIVVREWCHLREILNDHEKANTSIDIELRHSHMFDASHKNLNLIDRWRMDWTDELHPYHKVYKAITDEINVAEAPSDTSYGIEGVLTIDRISLVNLGTAAEPEMHETFLAEVIMYGGEVGVIRIIMSVNGDCLTDYIKLDACDFLTSGE